MRCGVSLCLLLQGYSHGKMHAERITPDTPAEPSLRIIKGKVSEALRDPFQRPFLYLPEFHETVPPGFILRLGFFWRSC